MEFRIYVASLSDYNNGILHGTWIDVIGLDEDALQEEINEMLEKSPTAAETGEGAEEWAIHDTDGVDVSEHESLEDLVKIGEGIEKYGEAFMVGYSHVFGEDIDEALDNFEDAYVGECNNFLDYATEWFDEVYLPDVPQSVRYYIDYESFARNLEHDYHHVDGHLFRTNW